MFHTNNIQSLTTGWPVLLSLMWSSLKDNFQFEISDMDW